MEHITIKKNNSFLELVKISHIEESQLAENILRKAIEAGAIYDEPESCGEKLVDHFENEGHKPTAATLYCLGKAKNQLTGLFSELVVWGKQNECPYCGSVVDVSDGDYESADDTGHRAAIWEKFSCSNKECLFTYTEDNEPDPDANRD